ncbi:unnamed protein product (macronuclear) [Paramecium tetraurelia]|uniref:Uncharacterized protein n=1 Tax=Paramecium tetraurelia TaxID=5888 RepID=A0DZ34_PARTE|nr:uncharacterized protein GSPATT00003270001 [Paramecium tetraurelia]CAK88301.1 unnamed protein product [Paramecium tetraurelia]|eukprot:XP_001455698.1 hypothetical protein (macronuclear) [Paramecium tetraurelia strain d4-2]
MGNACLHRLDNKRSKIIKINGYPKLHCPNKLILEPCIQNITQNLDTFEEDFFKSEFNLDNSPDNQRNQTIRKVKLESTIEDIKKLNSIECPSYFDEKSDFQLENSFDFVLYLNSKDRSATVHGQKRNHKKKNKQKVSLQKIQRPKSILKTTNQQHNSSFCSSQYVKSQKSVTFSLDTYNSRNLRSLSPMLHSIQGRLPQEMSRSMTYLQQFPYL